MTEIGTPQALGDVKLVAVGLAAEAKPATIAESDRVDDERVAVPSPNLMAEPIRTNSRGVRPAVELHLCEYRRVFDDEHERRRMVDEFEEPAGEKGNRGGWLTKRRRPVFEVVIDAFFQELRGPRLKVDPAQIGRTSEPYAREIRLAVG